MPVTPDLEIQVSATHFLKMGGASVASKESDSLVKAGRLWIRRRQRFQRNKASSFPCGRIFSAFSSKQRIAFSKLAIRECAVWPARTWALALRSCRDP